MTVMEEAIQKGEAVRETLRRAASHVESLEMLVMKAHRDGFVEALDLLGAPAADTPMERVALAGVDE